ncbi:MAG TPA: hypothetical protein P5534_22675, partial [Candidatus Paceibacterota bacterium]|nr:hypothetical protein [Candidatus Paceibacterota bacterium]
DRDFHPAVCTPPQAHERGRLVRSTNRWSATVSATKRLTAPPAGGVARAPIPTTSGCTAHEGGAEHEEKSHPDFMTVLNS